MDLNLKTYLNHKVWNYPMKFRVIVITSSDEFGKVTASLGRMIPIQFNGDVPHSTNLISTQYSIIYDRSSKIIGFIFLNLNKS